MLSYSPLFDIVKIPAMVETSYIREQSRYKYNAVVPLTLSTLVLNQSCPSHDWDALLRLLQMLILPYSCHRTLLFYQLRWNYFSCISHASSLDATLGTKRHEASNLGNHEPAYSLRYSLRLRLMFSCSFTNSTSRLSPFSFVPQSVTAIHFTLEHERQPPIQYYSVLQGFMAFDVLKRSR